MQVTLIADSSEMRAVLLELNFEARPANPTTPGVMHSDLTVGKAITIALQSITQLPGLAKNLCEKLADFIKKPGATFEVVTPNKTLKISLYNMTETTLLTLLQQAFAISSGNVDGPTQANPAEINQEAASASAAKPKEKM